MNEQHGSLNSTNHSFFFTILTLTEEDKAFIGVFTSIFNWNVTCEVSVEARND